MRNIVILGGCTGRSESTQVVLSDSTCAGYIGKGGKSPTLHFGIKLMIVLLEY